MEISVVSRGQTLFRRRALSIRDDKRPRKRRLSSPIDKRLCGKGLALDIEPCNTALYLRSGHAETGVWKEQEEGEATMVWLLNSCVIENNGVCVFN